MGAFLQSQLDYVYFTYGLLLLLLGAVALGMCRSGPVRIPWWLVGIYGLLCGTAEWMELAALTAGDATGFVRVRTLVEWAGFAAMLEFARRVQRTVTGASVGAWLHAVPAVAVLALAWVFGPSSLPTAIRLLILLPASLWTAALCRAGADQSSPLGSGAQRAYRLGALGFALYGVCAGIILPAAPFLPAGWPTEEAFLRATGVPVQVLRGAAVAVMTFAIWSLAVALTPRGRVLRKKRLLFWVIAAAFNGALVGGWLFTESMGRLHERDLQADARSAAARIFGSIRSETLSADSAVRAMADLSTRFGLVRGDGLDVARLNDVADSIVHGDGNLVAYVLDAKGITVASSNRAEPQSFVGKDLAFRPYFQEAIGGRNAAFLGLGTVSGLAGYYASAPLVDPDGGVAGVAVVKHNLGSAQLGPPGVERACVVSPQGRVLVSNDALLMGRSLWPGATSQDGAPATEALGDVPPLAREPVHGTSWATVAGQRHVSVRTYLPGSDWSLVVLKPETTKVSNRFLGIVITLLFALLVLGGFMAAQGQFRAEASLTLQKAKAEGRAEEAARRADTDALTGLMNRMGFNGAISREVALARRHGTPFSLLLLDLDHFKKVNDTHGHQVGDEVLVGAARLIEGNVRESDLVARWGGEEFVVVAPMTPVGGAEALGEKIRELMATTPMGAAGQVTVSVGVAELRPGETIESLLERADLALYRAKRSGRNRVERDDPWAPVPPVAVQARHEGEDEGLAHADHPYPDTGYEPVNEEHRAVGALFQLFVDKVNAGAADEARQALRVTVEALQEHFAHEEELMRRQEYPHRSAHETAHQIFLKDVGKFRVELEAKGLTPDVRRWAVGRLSSWFGFHVSSHDIAMGQFLRRRLPGAAPEGAKGSVDVEAA